MNTIRAIIRNRPTRNFSVMAGYKPEDMNKEYENVGHDLTDMAGKFKEGFKDVVGYRTEITDEMEDEMMYVAMFFDP